MRRSFARVTVGAVCSLAILPGCGDSMFGPGPARKSRPVVEVEAAKTLFFVLPISPDTDNEGWVVYAQREANNERAIFRCLGPAPGESASKLPDLVRLAVADGASALLVTPRDVPGLPEALAEAESKKVPVVLLGKPVEPPAGSRPFTLVTAQPFDVTADRIVETTLMDAMAGGRPKGGTALILAERPGDFASADRVAALKSAAEKVGLKPKLVEFDPPADSPSAKAAGQAILDTPDASIVVSADETGMMIASRIHHEATGGVKVFVGGYISFKNGLVPSTFANESCVVEYRSEEIGRLAVRAALDRLRGEESGRRYEHEPRFRAGQGRGGHDPLPAVAPTTKPAPAADEPASSTKPGSTKP